MKKYSEGVSFYFKRGSSIRRLRSTKGETGGGPADFQGSDTAGPLPRPGSLLVLAIYAI